MKEKKMVLSGELTIDDVYRFVNDLEVVAKLPETDDFKNKIEKCRSFLFSSINCGIDVYGATTGLGASSSNRLEVEDAEELQQNLMAYHGCGIGENLSYKQSLATLLLRTHCLSLGHSGVSHELLKKMEELLSYRVAPCIPSRGSVGASGDLTPLSYVAAVINGKRKLEDRTGKVESATKFFSKNSITPYKMQVKESLAVMNGTAVMTAVAALAHKEVQLFADVFCKISGLLVELLDGRSSAFSPELHAVKPHPGQKMAADNILAFMNNPLDRINKGSGRTINSDEDGSIQDVYSLRCSPQVIGVLYDVLSWSENVINIELNSTTDNPVIDADRELVLNGGHFFGGHIASVCDTLKTALYNVVNLADRQMALLMGHRVANKLSENLVSVKDLEDKAHIHHGFKAMQITLSALASEIQKMSLPMSIYSRSTESSNQDVTSMGTHAAIDLSKMIDLAKYSLTILAMGVRQGLYLKERKNGHLDLNDKAKEYLNFLESNFSPVIKDRELDSEIETLKKSMFEDIYNV